MNLRSYATTAQNAITEAFYREGLAVRCLGCKQGPHTLTYALQLAEGTKANLAKALSMDGVIELAIYDEPVRTTAKKGMILVEIPSPSPVLVDGSQWRGQGVAVPIGLTTMRSIRGVDFANPASPHLLVVAPSGRGKSTTARTVLYHVAKQNRPSQAQLIIATFKPADWQAFAGLPHTMKIVNVGANPGEVSAMLKWVDALTSQRALEGTSLPHVFVMLDDMLNIANGNDVGKEVANIASLGRAAGVHLIVSSQRVGKAGTGDVAVTSNITTRVVLGTSSAQDAAQFTGTGKTGAERLGRYPGDALLVVGGTVTRLAVGLVKDSHIEALSSGAPAVEVAPWHTPKRRREAPQDEDLQPEAPITFPLPRRSPTHAEAVAILKEYRELGSKNKTAVKAYGAKNSQTMALVGQALAMLGEVEKGKEDNEG